MVHIGCILDLGNDVQGVLQLSIPAKQRGILFFKGMSGLNLLSGVLGQSR